MTTQPLRQPLRQRLVERRRNLAEVNRTLMSKILEVLEDENHESGEQNEIKRGSVPGNDATRRESSG